MAQPIQLLPCFASSRRLAPISSLRTAPRRRLARQARAPPPPEHRYCIPALQASGHRNLTGNWREATVTHWSRPSPRPLTLIDGRLVVLPHLS
uniref:Uncharacterized protein n=1 Tax=Oryza punctata TaxID=4537 RepID=A0A0E0KKP5_ORYPU